MEYGIKLSETTASAGAGTEWSWDSFWSTVIGWLSTHGIKLLIGLVVLFICFWIVNIIAKGVRKGMIKHGRDKTITSVVYQVIKKGVKLVLFVLFLGYVGIDTAGIGAIIGAIGVAIGLAAQGALSNFAGGMIILASRPFKVGDYISADGEEGTVDDIRMFYTYLITPNNQVVMIPNGEMTSGAIVNYTKNKTRRLELKFSISYSEDFERAKSVIREIIGSHEKILPDPAPFVRVGEHADSAIIIYVRVWTNIEDYWDVRYDLLESVKRRFDEENIEIPFPQLDVHIPEHVTKAKEDSKKRVARSRKRTDVSVVSKQDTDEQ